MMTEHSEKDVATQTYQKRKILSLKVRIQEKRMLKDALLLVDNIWSINQTNNFYKTWIQLALGFRIDKNNTCG